MASDMPAMNAGRGEWSTSGPGLESAATSTGAPARPGKAGPAGEKRDTTDGSCRAERTNAGQREQIEAAGKNDDPDQEQEARSGRRTTRPAAACPGDGEQRERVNQLVAHTGLEDRKHVGWQTGLQTVCAESARRDTQQRHQRADDNEKSIHARRLAIQLRPFALVRVDHASVTIDMLRAALAMNISRYAFLVLALAGLAACRPAAQTAALESCR